MLVSTDAYGTQLRSSLTLLTHHKEGGIISELCQPPEEGWGLMRIFLATEVGFHCHL